ncbi:inovirus-type Gp2 protein [Pseudomonas sp. NPDC096950]|uniref:YagK/YfjJ domain-containing protein n=1 Tax=Pseudomonas sp. NPDC096950 TaxID=3364485 RepID=UPI00383A6AAD
MTITVTYEPTYRGYSINACKTKEYGVITDIMKNIIDQIEHILSHHSRISVIRFDCHFPKNWTTNHKLENERVSQLTKMLRQKLGSKKWLEHKNIVQGWAYEVGDKSKRGHYHYFIAFKALYYRLGSFKGGTYTGLYGLIKDCWSSVVDGHVEFAGTHTVNRSNRIQINNCIYHLSYLAKVRDKQFGQGSTAKNYSLSRLSRKDKTIAPTANDQAEGSLLSNLIGL